MPTDMIQQSARALDLSPRFVQSTVIVASPAAAAETIIAQVAIPGNLTIVSGVLVLGWAAYTIGATGVSCQLRLRQTNVAGTVVSDSGAQTGGHNTAGQLVSDDINGFDTAPPAGGVYVMTLQVASGSGASTVTRALIACMAV
jgi:hypothetical protein